jgi:hypothetical protein
VVERDGTTKTATHGVLRRPPFLLTQILSVNPQESRAPQYGASSFLGPLLSRSRGGLSPPSCL